MKFAVSKHYVVPSHGPSRAADGRRGDPSAPNELKRAILRGMMALATHSPRTTRDLRAD